MRMACLGIIFLWTIPVFAQPGPLDLVPAEADLAVAVRNLEELIKKGDKLAVDADYKRERPSQWFTQVFGFLGILNGLDTKGAAAIFLIRPEKNKNKNLDLEDLISLVGVIPFKDRDTLAEELGGKKGLKPGVITATQNNKIGQGSLFVGERHIYFSPREESLRGLTKRKTLAQDLRADRRKTLQNADILVQLTPKILPELFGRRDDLDTLFPKGDDPAEQKLHKEFMASLASLQRLTAGVSIDDGLGINLLAQFAKDGKARDFLTSLTDGKTASHLKGLPDGRVLAAQATAGDGTRTALIARLLLQFALKNFLESQQIVSATDRPNFVGVFNEVWQHLQGSRAAVYLTRDEVERGLFSFVAILDTEDAGKFLKDMKTLAKIADGSIGDLTKIKSKEIDAAQLVGDLGNDSYRIRESATTRLRLLGEPALPFLDKIIAANPSLETLRRASLLRLQIGRIAGERRRELLAKDLPRFVRPKFSFIAKAETRAGFPIDMIHLKLTDKDWPINGQMKKLFGPDWDRLRLAVHGNQIVVMLGSEVELFEAALRNLKEGKPGLAGSKSLTAFNRRANPKRSVEFHLSMETMLSLISPDQLGKRLPDTLFLSSFGLTVETDHLQLDLWTPTPEIKRIVKNNGF